MKTLYVGVYYGRQESIHTEKAREEMAHLADELEEMKNEGEVILCMDANAKIGLMGEQPSRNGRMMMDVFNECEMIVINKTEKCEGVITRQNRTKQEEKSSIDFVTATYAISQSITRMLIDENGDHRLKSKKESDHNTIIVDVKLNLKHHRQEKKTQRNLKAPAEKWALFREELGNKKKEANNIMSDRSKSITERYKKWGNIIDKAARKTIGKTTVKPHKPDPSECMQLLRKERKELKVKFEKETEDSNKIRHLKEYIKKQEEIRLLATKEEEERTAKKFEKMMQGGVNGFWKERKILKSDQTGEWMIVKDESGKRIMDPEKCKDIVATHYERLYSIKPVPFHPWHAQVKERVEKLGKERTSGPQDMVPSRKEIKEVIHNKKNNKATTDWKNEIVKRGGDEMVDVIYPVIEAFWEEEKPPKPWNQGVITNVWKGKGDREKMDNQRGITVSSSIGTIAEEIITNRMLDTIQFSQAQAGGRKGGSTTDQIFILKAMIAVALKTGQELFVTFFDIKKAYDRANMGDMLHVIHEQGFRGKIWRLTKALNENLTSTVKTKAGISREIVRHTGGKQGGKAMVPMFSKMMDTLPEELASKPEIGVKFGNSTLAALAFVDGVGTFAVGHKQQETTLNVVNEFAIKRQLEWGTDKCKVMEIGVQKQMTTSWKLGEKTIGNCDSYRYLGEEISRDGKNQRNLAERVKKVKGAVRAIMTCAKSDVMRRIETSVLLRLNTTVTMPTLLSNSETWTLNKGERNEIDKIHVWAWKQMLGLPMTTPSPAVVFATGSIYGSIQVEIKQLIYLHKLLQREEDSWAKEALMILEKYDISWAKRIKEVLQLWGLEEQWNEISKKTKGQWKKEVQEAAEKANTRKLHEECQSKGRGEAKAKTKTKTIIDKLNQPTYQRKPLEIMKYGSVLVTRALIMGRYGMLKCRANFSSGYGNKSCPKCNTIDDERHRINYCPVYQEINLYDCENKLDFDLIYSDDLNEILKVVEVILKLWDLGFGKNSMRMTAYQ